MEPTATGAAAPRLWENTLKPSSRKEDSHMAPTVKKTGNNNSASNHATKHHSFGHRKGARGAAGIVFPPQHHGYPFYPLESHSMSGSPPRNSPVSWKAGQQQGRMIPRRSTAGSSSDESAAGSPTRSPVPALVNKPAWDMDTLKSQIVNAKAGTSEVARAIESCTFKPREQAFTALIDLAGRMRDWRKALEVFESMKKIRGVRPNKYTYSALIAACSSSGEWERALEVFGAMQRAARSDPHCRPNQVTYGALISACERGGMHDVALEKFHEMRELGIRPDQVTYTSVLCSCEKSLKWDEAAEIIEEAHSKGFVAPPSVYYELLLHYAEKADYVPALDLFITMQMADVDPDVHTCRALMSALCNAGQDTMALDLLNSMEQSGILVDLETYNLALRTLAKAGRWQAAIQVLEGIRRAGLEPSTESSESVAEACQAAGEKALAEQFLGSIVN